MVFSSMVFLCIFLPVVFLLHLLLHFIFRAEYSKISNFSPAQQHIAILITLFPLISTLPRGIEPITNGIDIVVCKSIAIIRFIALCIRDAFFENI